MADQSNQALYEKFFEIVGRGDEAAAREFLVTNLKEFPQEMQDAIVMAFFEEALAKRSRDDRTVSEFQKQGMQTASALEKLKEELEKKLKLSEIKESL